MKHVLFINKSFLIIDNDYVINSRICLYNNYIEFANCMFNGLLGVIFIRSDTEIEKIENILKKYNNIIIQHKFRKDIDFYIGVKNKNSNYSILRNNLKYFFKESKLELKLLKLHLYKLNIIDEKYIQEIYKDDENKLYKKVSSFTVTDINKNNNQFSLLTLELNKIRNDVVLYSNIKINNKESLNIISLYNYILESLKNEKINIISEEIKQDIFSHKIEVYNI